MTEEYGMYNRMMEIFTEHTSNNESYDVEDFLCDLEQGLFIETDPQDIDEDDYVVFQSALILLVRDNTLLDYFGIKGLSVLHADLMHWFGLAMLCTLHADLMHTGEQYYINKVIFQKPEEA